MALLALFPIAMLGVLLMVFTMILDDSHTDGSNYILAQDDVFEEDLWVA